MIETKEIDGCKLELIDDYINCFGYVKKEVVSRRCGRVHRDYVVVSRDTGIKHYNDIAKLESIWESNNSEMEELKEVDGWTTAILLLLLLIPGILYLVIISLINKKISERNDDRKYNSKLAKEKARKLLHE